VLAGHTDTVPIENNWPSRLDNDIIYGRGASDMKAGLAVMVELARRINEVPIDLQFDLGLLFFGREELPGDECPLLNALDDPAFSDIDLAILMEPTSNAIEAGCLGNLNLKVAFTGSSAHSARPWQGDNAVHKSIIALHEFVNRPPEPITIDGLEFTEVTSITKVSGGVAMNVVPSLVEYHVNIRYSPQCEPQAAERTWQDYFEAMGAQVEVTGNARSAPVRMQHPLVQRLKASGVEAVWAKQAWTNVADFAAHDIAAINFGPGNPLFAHKQDEQVDVAALETSLMILERFVSGPAA
jgi:succinyl-diaminopimelate desuccinylase